MPSISGKVEVQVTSERNFNENELIYLIERINKSKKIIDGNEKEINAVINEIEKIRKESGVEFRDLFDALSYDIKNYNETKNRFDKVKKIINEGNEKIIFSYFEAEYFEKLSLDLIYYDEISVNGKLVEKYSTNVAPINLRKATNGFLEDNVVALFPENHLDKIQIKEDKIFYIINKFVERFNKKTRNLLSFAVTKNSFQKIRNLSVSEIERSAVYWVWLHEYFHRKGSLPLPKYLEIKSYKPLAGLEECRVDMYGILTLLSDNDLPQEEAIIAAEFILAERLLRYAVEGVPIPNYDAIGSQVLFNYLKAGGFLELINGKIHVTDDVVDGIRAFLDEIEKIESGILNKEPLQVKMDLIDLTKKYTCYDNNSKQYIHDPVFYNFKKRLQEIK